MDKDKLLNLIVIKRSGKKVTFDGTKIAIAIKKGFDSIEGKYNEDDANIIYNKVIEKILKQETDKIKIEQIQDFIEEELKENGYQDVYESFSNYREKRNQSREIFFEEKRKHKFLKALEKVGLNSKENGEIIGNNKDADENMNEYGKVVAEEFATSYLIKKRFSDSHNNGDIYINNIESYSTGTMENTQIDLEKLFTNGFSTRKCSMREPQSIESYAILSVIAIHSNQKEQSKEQSIPAFDFYMEQGVIKTFRKEFRQTINDLLEYSDFDKFIAINGIEREINKINSIDFNIEDYYKFTRDSEELKRMFRIAYKKALNKTNIITFQAMEGFVHDLNSICENQITTINIGTNTSKEGRMIISNILKTIDEGIGENKSATSPKIVFKVKNGKNLKKGDKNYDLFQKACQIALKTDNISFSNLDATYNSFFYKEGDFNTEVAYFYDGTRVIDNYIDEDKRISQGRGVISSTIINLPRIALKHVNDIDGFYEELNQRMELVKDQMMERLEIQSAKTVENFSFLMGQGVWIDSDKLKSKDKVKKVIKQGILKISFTGLNETLIALLGANENAEEAKKIGYEIVSKMRKITNEFSKKYNLNFVLAGNYDENVNKDFLEFDRIIFGKVVGVTDKEKYTSSFKIKGINKINEAQFFELTNGGHRFDIEIENMSDISNYEIIKEEAFKLEKNIKKAFDNDIGYITLSRK